MKWCSQRAPMFQWIKEQVKKIWFLARGNSFQMVFSQIFGGQSLNSIYVFSDFSNSPPSSTCHPRVVVTLPSHVLPRILPQQHMSRAILTSAKFGWILVKKRPANQRWQKRQAACDACCRYTWNPNGTPCFGWNFGFSAFFWGVWFQN